MRIFKEADTTILHMSKITAMEKAKSENQEELGDSKQGEETDQELKLDDLDDTSADEISPVKDKKSTSKKIPKKEKKDLRARILQDFSEDDLTELLEAKKMLEEQTQTLEEQNRLLAEYEDLLKRKQAEFENYRKRIQKEVEEEKKYAMSDMVLDIVNIIDDFERAINSVKSSRDFNTLLEGIVIIEKQLKAVLENKHGVKPIEAVGKEFDPTVHNAVLMEESEEYREDTVIEDFQKGYTMHDRIIRPSKVKVAKAVSSGDNQSNNGKETTTIESSGEGE